MGPLCLRFRFKEELQALKGSRGPVTALGPGGVSQVKDDLVLKAPGPGCWVVKGGLGTGQGRLCHLEQHRGL